MAYIQYPLAYNPVIEYWNKIESGEEVVGDKIRRVYKKIIHDMNDVDSEYEYNSNRALHPIEFIENFCKHSKGKWAGLPIELELWQKAMTAAMFGFVHKIDGTRKYQQVFTVIGRKNGKSTIGSGIGLYLMVGDNEGGSEVYAVATKRDQAKLVWLEAKKMVKKSPILLDSIKPLVSEMTAEWNESSFKPLGSDSETLDGLNVHGAIMDEVAAWKDQNLFDVIVDGTTARDQPMILMITTAGTVRESVYDLKYSEAEMVLNGFDDVDGYKDDRFLPFIYEIDKREEWTDPQMWKKANPALGTIKKIDQLETKVNKAKSNPMLVKNLITKEFNVRDTSSEAWLTFEQINNPSTFDITELKPRYAIGGVDLASSVDLTSACILFKINGDPAIYAKHMYWLPEDLLEQRTREDSIPYDIWRDLGWLRTTPGNKVHHKFVTEWFIEMREEYDVYIPWVGYDSWSAQYFVEEMQNYFGKESMIPVIQGKKTLSAPMKSLGADLDAKKINYGNNPITKWCLTNTSVDIDKNDNIQPSKGKSQRKRIDGLAAMLDAYVILHDKQTDYENQI